MYPDTCQSANNLMYNYVMLSNQNLRNLQTSGAFAPASQTSIPSSLYTYIAHQRKLLKANYVKCNTQCNQLWHWDTAKLGWILVTSDWAIICELLADLRWCTARQYNIKRIVEHRQDTNFALTWPDPTWPDRQHSYRKVAHIFFNILVLLILKPIWPTISTYQQLTRLFYYSIQT